MTLTAVALTFAQWRYRAPSESALVLLAAVAIEVGLVAMLARRQRRPASS
jgi:hypothetical protein